MTEQSWRILCVCMVDSSRPGHICQQRTDIDGSFTSSIVASGPSVLYHTHEH